VTIRTIEPSNAATGEGLRRELWPEDPESHGVEIASFFAGMLTEPQAVLVVQEGPTLVAFAELSLRDDIPQLSFEVILSAAVLQAERRISCAPQSCGEEIPRPAEERRASG